MNLKYFVAMANKRWGSRGGKGEEERIGNLGGEGREVGRRKDEKGLLMNFLLSVSL